MRALRVLPAVACASVLIGGCTPETVPTVSVETIRCVFVRKDGIASVYGVGERQRSLLRDEFEAWKRAGFEGFDESFIRCQPTFALVGTSTNGVAYKIDFRQGSVMVLEDPCGMVDGARYARELTAADKRLQLFLETCISEGRLPRVMSGKLPGNN